MSRSQRIGLFAFLASLASCAEAQEPASQDAALVDLPAPISRTSADAYATAPSPAAPSVALVARPGKPAPEIELDEPPITRTLVRPPTATASSSPAATPQSSAVANASAADKAAARQLFQEGVEAFANGDYPKARASFERAYKLVPTYRVLYNIGQTAKAQGDRAGKCRAFRGYLREASPEEVKNRGPEIKNECP